MIVTQDDRMIRQSLSFVKMHGLGNDYIYIDRFTESASFDPAALATTALRIGTEASAEMV